MKLAMELIKLTVMGVVIFCPVSYFLGRAILNPLKESRAQPVSGTQFRITDFYVLLLQLGGAGLLVMGKGKESDQDQNLLILIVSWATLIFWWWLGIRRLSHAGILDVQARAVVLGLAVPFAYGNFLLPALCCALVADGMFDSEVFFKLVFVTSFLLVLFMVFSGCRSLVLWAIERSAPGPAKEEESK